MKKIIVGGEELQVMYAGVSPFENHLKSQIYYGTHGLVQIAALLDGNEGIEYHYDESGEERVETFIGYSHLTKIEYVDEETMLVFLGYVEPEPQPEPEPTPEPEEQESEPENIENQAEGSEE